MRRSRGGAVSAWRWAGRGGGRRVPATARRRARLPPPPGRTIRVHESLWKRLASPGASGATLRILAHALDAAAAAERRSHTAETIATGTVTSTSRPPLPRAVPRAETIAVPTTSGSRAHALVGRRVRRSSAPCGLRPRRRRGWRARWSSPTAPHARARSRHGLERCSSADAVRVNPEATARVAFLDWRDDEAALDAACERADGDRGVPGSYSPAGPRASGTAVHSALGRGRGDAATRPRRNLQPHRRERSPVRRVTRRGRRGVPGATSRAGSGHASSARRVRVRAARALAARGCRAVVADYGSARERWRRSRARRELRESAAGTSRAPNRREEGRVARRAGRRRERFGEHGEGPTTKRTESTGRCVWRKRRRR